MPYVLATGWILTTGLFAFLVLKVLDRQDEERQAHRTEVAHAARALLEQVQMQRVEVDAITSAHAERISELLTAHRREVASLCQRIQAPQVAVAQHAATTAPPDPPQVDLENDLALIADRERQLREFAEELATER